MSDAARTDSQPIQQININENQELQHWVGKLGCTEEQLRMAVALVGPEAGEVCNHFGTQLH
ncbi:MAG: DUF3606 domain-containing protein [Pseudomonadota bacterium]